AMGRYVALVQGALDRNRGRTILRSNDLVARQGAWTRLHSCRRIIVSGYRPGPGKPYPVARTGGLARTGHRIRIGGPPGHGNDGHVDGPLLSQCAHDVDPASGEPAYRFLCGTGSESPSGRYRPGLVDAESFHR